MFRKTLLAFSLFLLPAFACAQESVLVTLKLIKAPGATSEIALSPVFPEDCTLCQNVTDPAYARQNAREIILAMRLPKNTSIPLQLAIVPEKIHRIRLENSDLPFTAANNGIRLTIPAQKRDRSRSGDFQTHLTWPGIDLRIEHADPLRRAGDYATGEFPALERQAALNLEFGLLEAIRKLSLDKTVVDRKLGVLKLMGFDTNYPHGHKDSPPHAHLALWLPAPDSANSKMPHLYLTPQGLLSHSRVSAPKFHADYGPTQIFTVLDPAQNPVYSLTITAEGGLQLALPEGPACTLKPHGSGFQSGAVVLCPGSTAFIVQAEDNLEKGETRESIDGKQTGLYRFDAETGALLRP